MHTHTDENTDPQCQQSHWGQHLFGDKVTLLPRGLWTGTMKASHPAQTQPAVLVWWLVEGRKGEKGELWGALQHPTTVAFKALFRKPPEIAPFTPRTDRAKSTLVTQSHAVNRWSCYWVKDLGGRGGSLSIHAGNNGAAGQECCLSEEGSGRRGMLPHSPAVRASKLEELRECLWD